MADPSGPIGPHETDELMQQAQETVAPQPPGATTTSGGQSADEASRSVTGDEVESLLDQAEQALASADEAAANGIDGIQSFELRDFAAGGASGEKATIELLRDVELDVRIELGRTHMHLEEVLKLRKGSVVSLDKLAGDPVDVYVNGRLIARGEVLVLNDNFCVRVAQLMSSDDA